MVNQLSFIRLWWRWKVFYRRNFSFSYLCLLFVAFLCITRTVPNPFSSNYSKISLKQDVQWDSVSELLHMKEQIARNDSLSNQIKITDYGSIEQQKSSPLLILLYTTVFLNRKYCRSTIDQIFGSTCPSKNNCKWSCDHRYIREADAIIFHAYDIQYYSAQVPSRSETKRNAIWILWSDEPPSLVDYNLFISYKFNWTISYKSNSEVSIGSYGLFTKRRSLLSDDDYNQWIEKEFNRRSNGALWFVSNCDPKQRLEYFNKLRYETDFFVEGYGRCVDRYPMHLCTLNSKCEYDYMSKFKFYLSFESTTCRDYITEKFYRSFYHGLIPIAYGPKRSDYDRIAPNHSYIHIDDFNKDMNKLADYLKIVYSNITLYSMYHQWRKKYDIIIDGKAVERIRMCELCERLNKVRLDHITYYENIEIFYLENC